MATPRASTDPVEAADDARGDQSPPDSSGMSDVEILHLVALMLRRRSPDAVDPCLVWRIPGNTQQGCIPIPVRKADVSDLGELARDILEVLVDAEGWLNGAEIGKRLNPGNPVNHTDGTFRRAIDELKDNDLIEKPSQRKGYKAKK